MKKTIYLFIFSVLIQGVSHAQVSISKALNEIEQNNTELKVLREMITSQKLENRTLNNLDNPEAKLAHKPKRGLDPRNTEIEVTQGFDFPTAYKQRAKLIANMNEQEDIAYQIKRKEILLEANQLIVEYIFAINQMTLAGERTTYAKQMFEAYDKLFDEGQISILERNRTKMNLLDSQKDFKLIQIELQSITQKIQKMNGGIAMESLPQKYEIYAIPKSFDIWYENVKQQNPSLLFAERRWEMGKTEESLTRALNLPKFRAGYIAEIDPDQTRSGFMVSVSIPLWQGRNTVKAKKAKTIALQYEKQDIEIQFKENMHLNYNRSVELSKLLKEYKEIMDSTNNFILLKKSLELGRLDLIEYIQELIIYYESVDTYQQTEKEYQLALLELKQWDW